MSDQANVRNLHAGPTVPDFQHRDQSPLPEGMLDQIIARTVQALEQRATRPAPLQLNTWEDVENFAARMATSGLCPKDFKGKPDDIVIAVMMGKELGLPPMASLQSICVINGRPSVWGEAVPALCIQTGLVVDTTERFEGEGGELTAICTVVRRGFSPREGRFSIADATVAGLGNVHRQYPKDMIMWRARHRAWHGAFPDVLKGLGTAEIEADLANQPVWTMPRPSMSDTARNAKASGDAWDDSWFDGRARELFQEQDPWKWLGILLKALEAAPTLRDIKEIENLRSVMRASETAPAEVKDQIAAAFVAAGQRLSRPATAEGQEKPAAEGGQPRTEAPVGNAAPPDADTTKATDGPEAPEFEYAVLDETGEPVDGVIHTDALQWARAFAASADPTTMGYMAIREHNADAMEDARKHPEAAKIIDDLETSANIAPQNEEPPPTPTVIEPAFSRGKADWTQYLVDLTAALEAQDAKSITTFVDAQRARVGKFPQSARMAATKAVLERTKALGMQPLSGFIEAEKAPAAEAGNSTGDKDEKFLANFEADLAKARDIHEIRRLTNLTTTTATLARWDREGQSVLAANLRGAVAQREGEVKAQANG